MARDDVTTDCRSEDGVTVGLVDATIAIARVLAPRDFAGAAAREALRDLGADEDFWTVLKAAAAAAHEGGGPLGPRLLVQCGHDGCEVPVSFDPLNRCVGCEEYYCQTHIYSGTWYGGDVVNHCMDCVAADAEPAQY
jgi:hypothetical protein